MKMASEYEVFNDSFGNMVDSFKSRLNKDIYGSNN